MRRIVDISPADTAPGIRAILRAQGVPVKACSDERLRQMAKQAQELFRTATKPVGIVADIRKNGIESVYHGDGHNESPAPLEEIIDQSSQLTLYAVTVGEEVSSEISRLLADNELAPAAMLDAAASQGAELAAQQVEHSVRQQLKATNRWVTGHETMSFSPGYCGWHVSAQKKLFEYLRPQEIGITLTDSCLMQPLKSISGVIVTGPKKIFDFDDNYTFCDQCKTRSCRERLKAIRIDK